MINKKAINKIHSAYIFRLYPPIDRSVYPKNISTSICSDCNLRGRTTYKNIYHFFNFFLICSYIDVKTKSYFNYITNYYNLLEIFFYKVAFF
jgi:hypothetical protein